MKAVLFDLDGVIADTSVFHFLAWKKLIRQHFKRDIPDELEEKTKGVSREDSLRVILEKLNIQVSDTDFIQLCHEKNQTYLTSLEVLTPENILPGIAQLLADLQAKGIKIALASASKNGPFILEKLGLSSYFDAIANPANIKKGKPAPDIFLTAAAELTLAPQECMGIEDSIAGITAINQAGSLSVAVGGPELKHAVKRFENTSQLTLAALEKVWREGE